MFCRLSWSCGAEHSLGGGGSRVKGPGREAARAEAHPDPSASLPRPSALRLQEERKHQTTSVPVTACGKVCEHSVIKQTNKQTRMITGLLCGFLALRCCHTIELSFFICRPGKVIPPCLRGVCEGGREMYGKAPHVA